MLIIFEVNRVKVNDVFIILNSFFSLNDFNVRTITKVKMTGFEIFFNLVHINSVIKFIIPFFI